MSIQGIRIRYFIMAMAIIALAAGIYITLVESNGFIKTTATVVNVEKVPGEFSDDDPYYDVTVEYTVDGKTYTEKLDTSSSTYKVGKQVTVYYDPNDPSTIHSGKGFGVYLIIVGAVLLVITVFSIIRGRLSLKKLKQTEEIGKEAVYPPSVLGAERELYFLTDTGTPKYGHRIEDASRSVLYEAKMTKFTLTSPFGFDFIDHVKGTTKAHLVGHEESSEWGTLLLDNHHTFKFDGEDIWKHLKRNGIRVDSSYGGGSGKLIGVNYVIYRNDLQIARVESSSAYVHEEDAEKHSGLTSSIPVKGFYRIWTQEQELELLFVTLLAFARTEASADNGGSYKTLFGTFKNK